MKGLYFFALLLGNAYAFPAVLLNLDQAAEEAEDIEARQMAGCSTSAACQKYINIPDSKIVQIPAGVAISKARSNCGIGGACLVFNEADQKVKLDGIHAWKGPTKGQIRGPCPGLNAAANHGYLPRSGVSSILNTIGGLNALFNMEADLSGFLAVYSVIIDGDALTMSWSIGGPPPTVGLTKKPQGISWSHNKYEGDTSICRCDAYINNGDGHSLSTTRFRYMIESNLKGRTYTMDSFSHQFAKNTLRSISQNPLYFAPLFSTTLVSPAAHNFVVGMFSNYSTEHPGGLLTESVFKSFFGVSGTYPNYKWLPGQERVPDNWYRRPSYFQYAIKDVFADLGAEFAAYPQSFRFGGNTGGVNTYTGIDIANFTGGVINGANLFQGNNFQCFVYQNLQQFVPDLISAGETPNTLAAALPLLNKYPLANPVGLSCPKIEKFNNNLLSKYPGRKYSPTGPATSC